MKHSAIEPMTGIPVTVTDAPKHAQYKYLPRIRCLDCPGKLYTPGPGTAVENFEVHLKNRAHREKVEARIVR